jgi:hypothetical protein
LRRGWLARRRRDVSISFDPLSAQGMLHALFSGLAAAVSPADEFDTPTVSPTAGFLLCERDSLAFRPVLAAAGIVTLLKNHKNFYASNNFLSDSNRVAPHIHRHRSKGAVCSCHGSL